MLKKTIKYEDFNGNEISEDFYFNLTKAELLEMESKSQGGLKAKLERLINTRDISAIMEVFKEVIVKSYGVKSDDGKRFMKSKEITDAFVESNAYSELYIELATDEDAAVAFITGIIPKDLSRQIDQATIDEIKSGAIPAPHN
jgi:hypothetical protein